MGSSASKNRKKIQSKLHLTTPCTYIMKKLVRLGCITQGSLAEITSQRLWLKYQTFQQLAAETSGISTMCILCQSVCPVTAVMQLHNSSNAEDKGWLVRLILCMHIYSDTRDGRVHCCTTVVTQRVGAGL